MNSRFFAWAAVAAAGAGAGLAGCESRPRTTTIQDTSAVRLSEARRLASQAQAEQAAGHSERAIALYRQAIDQSPDLGFAWNNLGLLYMEKDNYLDAVEMFQSAADLMHGISGAKPLYNIGLAYWKRGWPAKALDFFDKALERDPRDVDALRGAVLAAKSLDVADENALARVRRALMIETDPRFKRLEQSEQFRIESTLAKAKESAPLAIPTGIPVGEPVVPSGKPTPGAPVQPEPRPPLDLPPAPVNPPANPGI